MTAKTAKLHPMPTTTENTLQLDEAALAAARKRLSDGAVTPSYGPWRDARLASFEQVRDTPLLQQLLDRWLDLMSASPLSSMSQSVREALWWHYWIHAARREQERRGAQQDARFLGRLAQVATSS